MLQRGIEFFDGLDSMEEEPFWMSLERIFNPKTCICEELADRNGLHCHLLVVGHFIEQGQCSSS